MVNSVNVKQSNNTSVTIPVSSNSTSQIFINGGGGGGSGAYTYTTTLNNNTVFTNSSGKEVIKIPTGDEASVQITGKIKWNGEDLEERLERIESMLHIPTRDVILEEKYQKLKRLWSEYRTALEEYKTWERLKDSK